MDIIAPATDRWRAHAGDDLPAPTDHTLLTLAQWCALRATWPAHLAVGVIVPNDAEIEMLAPDLPRLALIVLQFPKWTDGRAYSQARLLRVRWRYAGELRASGDVVIDMMIQLRRTGFDAVELRAGQRAADALRALHAFSGHYQGDCARSASPVAPVRARATTVLHRRASAALAGEAA